MAGKASDPRSVVIYSLSWMPSQTDGVAVRMMAHTKELVARGVKVTVITPSYELNGQAASESKHTRIPGVEHVLVDTVPMPVYQKNQCAAVTFKNLFLLMDTINKAKPDIVHVTQCSSILLFMAACLFNDVPMLISMHTDVTQIAARDGGFVKSLGGRRAALLQWMSVVVINSGYLVTALHGAVFFCVSHQARQICKDSYIPDSLIFKENWGPMVDRQTFRIDLPEAEVAKMRQKLTFGLPNVYLLVYLGRVTAEKDVQFLVDALKRAPKNVVLALVGPGSLATEFSKIHGKESRLHCTGELVGREEAALILRAADCCVSASVMETVGFTAMEALSCGTPMLAANAQGFAEHLDHGRNARLWTPGDEASFDKELAAMMATKREGDWAPEALRASMESASLTECTDRAIRAYHFGSRKIPFRRLRAIIANSLILMNKFLFKIPDFFMATKKIA